MACTRKRIGLDLKTDPSANERSCLTATRRFGRILVAFFLCAVPNAVRGQDSKVGVDSAAPAVTKKAWNEFDLGFTSLRIGMAAIHEYAGYSQNAAGEAQMDSAEVSLDDAWEWRDFRFFANGKPRTKLPLIWKVAAMYDGVEKEWTWRETGVLIQMPRMHSEVFLGRSKEGYSLIKVQNGYSTWVNERQMSLDLIPIMTDGIRWYGYLPSSRFLWSVGTFFNDIYGNDRKFAPWAYQVSGRLGWRPIYTDAKGELLHLAVNLRYASPDNDTIRVRSKPESGPAPYFIDTGPFESSRSTAIGGEAYYRNGRFMTGTEFNQYRFKSEQAGNPKFPGFDVMMSWFFTNDYRPYLSTNSVFFFVEPRKSVLHGGLGAWEVVVRYSSFDLNHGLRPGGKFWKVTPMVNWYLDELLRLELVYGYGRLTRFNLTGGTHFFQTRFQLQVL